MALISLSIISPEKVFFNGDVDWVNVNVLRGKEEILPNHIPFASGILPSVLKIKQNGEIKEAAITGGFLEFSDNKAVLIVDSAEWPEEIDVKRAQEALDRAKKRLKEKGERYDVKRAKMAILRATARIKAAEFHKK
jgi:F-type H+-transporting ATPase subunit epsilon